MTIAAPEVLAAADANTETSTTAATSADHREESHEQLRFRRSMGLGTSVAVLERAAAANNDAADQFGIPLTDTELAELLRRDRVIHDDVPTVRETVAAAFEDRTLAGVWMDNRGGGVLTVAVTRSAAAVREELMGTVRHPESLRVITHRYSLTKLRQIGDDLRVAASNAGRDITGIRLDERANRLRVLTTDDVQQTRRWITGAVGVDAPVDVESASVAPVGTKYNNSPPLRGGQAINSNEGYTCTSAFTAQGSGRLYVLTAGHCSDAGWRWDQVGTPIGTADRSDVSGTDVLRIPVTGQLLANEVTLWYTPLLAAEARYRSIHSSQSSSADAVGQVSCITGQNFDDLRCGEIITRSFDVTDVPLHDGRQMTYTNGREIDADCNPGDSGGPALRGGQARGIVSVKVRRTLGNDTCVYVHIGPAMKAIGVTDVLVDDGPVLGI